MNQAQIKKHLIRFFVGFAATLFTLVVIFGLIALVAFYSIPLLWVLGGVAITWAIYRTGNSIVADLYDDKEVWSTIVEDYNNARERVKKFFRRG